MPCLRNHLKDFLMYGLTSKIFRTLLLNVNKSVLSCGLCLPIHRYYCDHRPQREGGSTRGGCIIRLLEITILPLKEIFIEKWFDSLFNGCIM